MAKIMRFGTSHEGIFCILCAKYLAFNTFGTSTVNALRCYQQVNCDLRSGPNWEPIIKTFYLNSRENYYACDLTHHKHGDWSEI